MYIHICRERLKLAGIRENTLNHFLALAGSHLQQLRTRYFLIINNILTGIVKFVISQSF